MTLRTMTNGRLHRCAALALTLAAVSACGGGGSGAEGVTEDPVIPGPTAAPEDVPRTTTGLRSAANDLLDIWTPNGVPTYTTLAAVPATGSASYEGYVYGDLSGGTATESLIGRLTLTAAFGSDDITFTGSARDFVDHSDDPLSGTLTVSGGSFDRNGNTASDATLRGVSVAGTLQGSETLEVGVQLEGDFLGISADAIGGEAIGRVTVGTTSVDFDGGFVAAD